MPFTRTEVTAIKCLSVLRKTSASLGTYKDIMEWHLKETGALQENATVGETSAYVSQKRMYDHYRPQLLPTGNGRVSFGSQFL